MFLGQPLISGAHNHQSNSTRALYDKYHGPLYQVERLSDTKVMNVSTLKPGGFADAAKQDAFCPNQDCVIK